ncbi:hypothetical protein AAHC03_05684 [Spirometra sp. Aus1]
MPAVGILIILGEGTPDISAENFQTTILNGLLTIPNYDSLGVNGFLSDIVDPKVDEDEGSAVLMFNAPEAHITVLQRPSVSLLLKHIETHFTSLPLQLCLVYSGLICEATGYWLLKDGIFKPSLLSDGIRVLSEKMVQTLADGTKDAPPVGLHIACTSVPSGGEWRSQLMAPHHLPPLAGRPLSVSVNRVPPPAKASAGTAKASSKPAGDSTSPPVDSSGAQSFCQRLMTQLPQPLFAPVDLAPHAVGASSIRISHPCLYVFPEGSGQSSIFAIPGFSLMVNAGYSHNPKCWKMAQHLDNVDAVLQTHWGVDNLLGLTSTLPLMLQASEAVPKVTCLLSPPPHFGTSVATGAGQGGDPMTISVVSSLSHLSEQVKPSLAQGRLLPIEVSRSAKLNAMPKVVSLYYKAGAGSLDLYPLTPSDEDHADVRKLTDLWTKAAPSFAAAVSSGAGPGPAAPKMAAAQKFAAPLVSQLSISALLVWTPARKTDPTLRILFVAPNAHQARVLMALDYLHAGLSCLRQAVYVAANAETRKPTGSAAPGSRPGTGTGRRAPTAPATAKEPAQRLARPAANSRLATGAPARAPAGNHTGAASTGPAKRPTTVPAAAAGNANKLTSKAAPTTTKTTHAGHRPAGVGHKQPAAAAAAAATATEKQNQQQFSPAVQSPPETVTPSTPVDNSADAGTPMSNGDAHSHAEEEKIAEMNGHNGVHVDGTSEDEDLVKMDHHHHDHEAEEAGTDGANDAPAEDEEEVFKGHINVHEMTKSPSNDTAEVPEHAVDSLVDWDPPQGLPPPTHPAARPAARAGLQSSAQKAPLEGYYEASSATLGPNKVSYDKFRVTFVDVAFLPGGGDVRLVDAEFFKRLRARYYVATTITPSADLLKALIVGKEAWTGDDKGVETSLILAHDTKDLLLWASVNEQRMLAAKVDLLTVADRSTIQLLHAPDEVTEENPDENVTCPGFRLDL